MKTFIDGYDNDIIIEYEMCQIYSDSELEKRGVEHGDLINHKGVVKSVYFYVEEELKNGNKKVTKKNFSLRLLEQLREEFDRIEKLRQKLPYDTLPF